MKSFLKLLTGLLSIVLLSCNKTEAPSGLTPTIHKSIDLDLNADGVIDYSIQYSGVDIEPILLSDGNYGITGGLRPSGENEVLWHTEETELFLRDLMNVKVNVDDPLSWRKSYSHRIVAITTINALGDWPDRWEVNSTTEHPSYYIGLKLITDSNVQLAWIEIEVNRNNGIIKVVDQGIL